MFVLPLAVVALLVWYLLICIQWKKKFFDCMEKIPGVKWYPVFGTTYDFVGVPRSDVLYKFAEIVGKYRPLFRSWNGSDAEINVMKPEHLQIIMHNSTHNHKGSFYDYLYEWLGDGVFLSKGAKWFMQRKLLTPTFHFKILEGFMEVFAEKSQVLVKELETKLDGNYFNIFPHVAACTLDIISQTSMGIPFSEVSDRRSDYIKSAQDFTEISMWRYFRPYYSWSPIFHLLPQGRLYRKSLKTLHEISDKIIAARKNLLRDTKQWQEIVQDADDLDKKKRLSFLDLLLGASGNEEIVSDLDVRRLVDTFLFAGFETTANGICWNLFLLGNFPEKQEKVYEEVARVLKDKPTPTSIADLNELKYLECALKESMRLYPVLPFITRVLAKDIQLDDYHIPAGTQAILHIFQTHRDPEQFPDPNNYIPERFLPENSKTRHPYAYIPFSAGPRNCIGQRFAMLEQKTVLATILKNYKVTSLETPEQKKLFAHVLIRPQGGINVKLEKRNM